MSIDKVGKHFKVFRKINEGAFAEIYHAINVKTNLQVAIKVQSVSTEHPQVVYECKLYNFFHNDPNAFDKGIPRVYYCTTQGDYNVLVMDLLGPSLEELLNKCLRKFSLKTVLMLMHQMIYRIEYIHSRRFTYRDIKPDNFCIGLNKTANRIFLIDFGFAKRFPQPRSFGCRRGRDLTGMPRYASINTHLNIIQSYRDDLQSLGYVAMYLLRGMLPWQGLKANSKRDKYNRIKEKKLSTSIEVLCEGYPVEFAKYLNTCRNLHFEDIPKYAEMRNMFKDLFQSNGFTYDYQYDWVLLAEKKEKMERAKEIKQMDSL